MDKAKREEIKKDFEDLGKKHNLDGMYIVSIPDEADSRESIVSGRLGEFASITGSHAHMVNYLERVSMMTGDIGRRLCEEVMRTASLIKTLFKPEDRLEVKQALEEAWKNHLTDCIDEMASTKVVAENINGSNVFEGPGTAKPDPFVINKLRQICNALSGNYYNNDK